MRALAVAIEPPRRAQARVALVPWRSADWAWEQLQFPEWWLGPARPRPARTRRSAAELEMARAAASERQKRRDRARQRQQRLRWPRKCSSLPRARTITAKRLSPEERKVSELLKTPGWDAARPKTRADCARQPRPCPWVSCRYNLYLDVAENGQSVKINFPDREPSDISKTGSCALDVADRVALGDHMTLGEIGQLMNLGVERVRQISSLALQGARIKTMWEDRLIKVRIPVGARRGAP